MLVLPVSKNAKRISKTKPVPPVTRKIIWAALNVFVTSLYLDFAEYSATIHDIAIGSPAIAIEYIGT